MINLIYTRFVIRMALAAIEGNEDAIKFFTKETHRRGVEGLLLSLSREIAYNTKDPEAPEESMSLIVRATLENRTNAFDTLRYWLKDAKHIDIVDPYLLSKLNDWGPSHINKFAAEFVSILPKGGEVNIFVHGYSQAVRTAVWRKLKEGRIARILHTDAFHDRFISTKHGVKIMGTSFNGLGRKISALTDLDKNDALEIKSAINDQKISAIRLAGPPF